MDYGALSRYFNGVAVKVLSAVDLSTNKSHQHEFNGTGPLRKLFGDDDIREIETTFAYLCDESEPVFCHGSTTWYDARRKHPTRTEYRLYYKENEVVELAGCGDLMVIARTKDAKNLILFALKGSTIEAQLCWLFGIENVSEKIALSCNDGLRVSSVAASILEMIGVDIAPPRSAENYLDAMVARFGHAFPKGADFSSYSASTLGELDWKCEPDASLVACYDREEMLFRVFERHLLERDLTPLLTTGALNVDGVLKTTMSTFQRRKSRAGIAFENQITMMFNARGIRYSSQKYTEGKSKPDFIFPSIEFYKDPSFPTAGLTMLGAKTTIKERWRQVLDEADRIDVKHLITLEPSVSTDYTKAMQKVRLQLVVPRQLFDSYTVEQRGWLINVGQFCELVESKQSLYAC